MEACRRALAACRYLSTAFEKIACDTSTIQLTSANGDVINGDPKSDGRQLKVDQRPEKPSSRFQSVGGSQ